MAHPGKNYKIYTNAKVIRLRELFGHELDGLDVGDINQDLGATIQRTLGEENPSNGINYNPVSYISISGDDVRGEGIFKRLKKEGLAATVATPEMKIIRNNPASIVTFEPKGDLSRERVY